MKERLYAFASSLILPPSSFALRPYARNLLAARGAESVRADPHLPNLVAVALYEKLIARRAVSVLPATDPSWQIAGIDELQPGLATDLARAHQLRGCRG